MKKLIIIITAGTAAALLLAPTKPSAYHSPVRGQGDCHATSYYVPSAGICVDVQAIGEAECLANPTCVADDVLYWRYRNTDKAGQYPSVRIPAGKASSEPSEAVQELAPMQGK